MLDPLLRKSAILPGVWVERKTHSQTKREQRNNTAQNMRNKHANSQQISKTFCNLSRKDVESPDLIMANFYKVG
jgi:hypothetical protein